MLQDVINDKMDQASVTMHDYFVAKTREITGLGGQVEEPATEVDSDAKTDEVVEATE